MKKLLSTLLFSLVAVAGQAQVKCHVEGTLETNAWGDEIIICEAGTDLRIMDDPRFHVKAKDGHFTYEIETDVPRLYEVYFLEQDRRGRVFTGKFIAEDSDVNVTMYEDKMPHIVTSGEEGRKHAVKDSIEDVRFWTPVQEIDDMLENPDRTEKFYSAGYISAISKISTLNDDNLPIERADSIRKAVEYYMQDDNMYTAEGMQLKQQRDSLLNDMALFRIAYAKEHPMLWTLYEVLDAIDVLKHADIYMNFDKSQFEPYLTLYHDKLINYYPDHPIHEQIAIAKTAYRLQPGKPYIDYTVRNTDGQLVPISSLIRGKVALIDLWASWCGPCRQHSIAMIPTYERYKNKGFTVIAIARERNRQAMENAAKKDGYPWQSLLELNDENGVWHKNGAGNSGGAMYLIDRDGIILSTSTDAEELEPIIKKALNIE